MNTRDIAAEYRLSHWAQVMQERIRSGLSIKAFCKQIGIGGNTYFYWQRKLREAAYEDLAARVEKEGASSEKSLIPSGWAVCKSAEEEVTGKAVTIEIGEFRVIAEAESDPEILVKVCRALKSLC